jgi:hypothetical protein
MEDDETCEAYNDETMWKEPEERQFRTTEEAYRKWGMVQDTKVGTVSKIMEQHALREEEYKEKMLAHNMTGLCAQTCTGQLDRVEWKRGPWLDKVRGCCCKCGIYAVTHRKSKLLKGQGRHRLDFFKQCLKAEEHLVNRALKHTVQKLADAQNTLEATRPIHVKSHGCYRGEFVVQTTKEGLRKKKGSAEYEPTDFIPKKFRQGLFKHNGRKYTATIRTSSGCVTQSPPPGDAPLNYLTDEMDCSRGFAFKLDMEGEQAKKDFPDDEFIQLSTSDGPHKEHKLFNQTAPWDSEETDRKRAAVFALVNKDTFPLSHSADVLELFRKTLTGRLLIEGACLKNQMSVACNKLAQFDNVIKAIGFRGGDIVTTKKWKDIMVRAVQTQFISQLDMFEIPAYFSATPYKLGRDAGTDKTDNTTEAGAVKYVMVPAECPKDEEDTVEAPFIRQCPSVLEEQKTSDVCKALPTDNKMCIENKIRRNLFEDDKCFSVMVQTQSNECDMPSEDGAVSWDQQESQMVRVGMLRIPSENQDLEDQVCTDHSFNPWYTLHDHEPLGSLNRARKHVYRDSFHYRSAKNSKRGRKKNFLNGAKDWSNECPDAATGGEKDHKLECEFPDPDMPRNLYRRFDGACNNLRHPCSGASYTQMADAGHGNLYAIDDGNGGTDSYALKYEASCPDNTQNMIGLATEAGGENDCFARCSKEAQCKFVHTRTNAMENKLPPFDATASATGNAAAATKVLTCTLFKECPSSSAGGEYRTGNNQRVYHRQRLPEPKNVSEELFKVAPKTDSKYAFFATSHYAGGGLSLSDWRILRLKRKEGSENPMDAPHENPPSLVRKQSSRGSFLTATDEVELTTVKMHARFRARSADKFFLAFGLERLSDAKLDRSEEVNCLSEKSSTTLFLLSDGASGPKLTQRRVNVERTSSINVNDPGGPPVQGPVVQGGKPCQGSSDIVIKSDELPKGNGGMALRKGSFTDFRLDITWKLDPPTTDSGMGTSICSDTGYSRSKGKFWRTCIDNGIEGCDKTTLKKSKDIPLKCREVANKDGHMQCCLNAQQEGQCLAGSAAKTVEDKSIFNDYCRKTCKACRRREGTMSITLRRTRRAQRPNDCCLTVFNANDIRLPEEWVVALDRVENLKQAKQNSLFKKLVRKEMSHMKGEGALVWLQVGGFNDPVYIQRWDDYDDGESKEDDEKKGGKEAGGEGKVDGGTKDAESVNAFKKGFIDNWPHNKVTESSRSAKAKDLTPAPKLPVSPGFTREAWDPPPNFVELHSQGDDKVHNRKDTALKGVADLFKLPEQKAAAIKKDERWPGSGGGGGGGGGVGESPRRRRKLPAVPHRKLPELPPSAQNNDPKKVDATFTTNTADPKADPNPATAAADEPDDVKETRREKDSRDDPNGLTAFQVAFGQILVHDIMHFKADETKKMAATSVKDKGDNGGDDGNYRGTRPAAGKGAKSGLRLPRNRVSTWLDGSPFYGNDEKTAKSLRVMKSMEAKATTCCSMEEELWEAYQCEHGLGHSCRVTVKFTNIAKLICKLDSQEGINIIQGRRAIDACEKYLKSEKNTTKTPFPRMTRNDETGLKANTQKYFQGVVFKALTITGCKDGFQTRRCGVSATESSNPFSKEVGKGSAFYHMCELRLTGRHEDPVSKQMLGGYLPFADETILEGGRRFSPAYVK